MKILKSNILILAAVDIPLFSPRFSRSMRNGASLAFRSCTGPGFSFRSQALGWNYLFGKRLASHYNLLISATAILRNVPCQIGYIHFGSNDTPTKLERNERKKTQLTMDTAETTTTTKQQIVNSFYNATT